MTTPPSSTPIPMTGFWLIERKTRNVAYEADTPVVELPTEIENSEHVEYFPDRAAAAGRIAEIGAGNIEEI